MITASAPPKDVKHCSNCVKLGMRHTHSHTQPHSPTMICRVLYLVSLICIVSFVLRMCSGYVCTHTLSQPPRGEPLIALHHKLSHGIGCAMSHEFDSTYLRAIQAVGCAFGIFEASTETATALAHLSASW